MGWPEQGVAERLSQSWKIRKLQGCLFCLFGLCFCQMLALYPFFLGGGRSVHR